jgi:hypothetical protein
MWQSSAKAIFDKVPYAPDQKSGNIKVYALSGPDRHHMHLSTSVPAPRSWFLSSLDPGSKNNIRFRKLYIILFYFEQVGMYQTEKNWANLQEFLYFLLLYPKHCH